MIEPEIHVRHNVRMHNSHIAQHYKREPDIAEEMVRRLKPELRDRVLHPERYVKENVKENVKEAKVNGS